MSVAPIHFHQWHELSFGDPRNIQTAGNADRIQGVADDLRDGLQIDDVIVSNPFHSGQTIRSSAA